MSAIRGSVSPLRRETLQDGVFRRLSGLILEGGIAPGESITVASLAEAFDVSPMPVREALVRLQAIGALTVVSGRTIGIPKLTRARLDDLTRVRLEVETTAVRWAGNLVNPEFLGDLASNLERLREAERTADAKLYVGANHDFHFHVYRAAGSPVLTGMIEVLWLQISPYFHLLRGSGNFHISNERHEELFEAFKGANVDRAVNALQADITGAYRVLCDLI